MAGIVQENLSLAQITRREVEMYAGDCGNCTLYPVLDDDNLTYTVVSMTEDRHSASVVVMAQIVRDMVVILEDTTDKPLMDALMVNAGVPRDKIILAYVGEKVPGTKYGENISLAQITRREVQLYAGECLNCELFSLLDDTQQIYAVVVLVETDRPASVMVMAQVIGDTVVILEDTTDKPLVDALMINGGVPRDKIVLAYKGEHRPESNP
jgi:hypothetical protein